MFDSGDVQLRDRRSPLPLADSLGEDVVVPVRTPPYGLSVWFVSVAIWLTWAPFGPRVSPVVFRLAPPTSVIDLAGNLILLAPLSILVAVTHSNGKVSRRLAAAALPTGLVGLFLEAAQCLLAERTVSPWDPALNIVGATLAAWAALALVRGGLSPRLALTMIGALVFAGVSGNLLYSSALVKRDFRLRDWDPSFEIAAGDEIGGNRRYRGSVARAWICAGSANQTLCGEPGAGPDTVRQIAARAETSQRVDLGASVISLDDSQSGPTRIITFSRSPAARNTTLAQEGQALVFRVRTPMTGPNGSRPEFHVRDAIHSGEHTNVSASFAGGHVQMRVERSHLRKDAVWRFGVLESWFLRRPYDFLTAPRSQRAAVVSGLILFLPIGLAIGWKLPPRHLAFGALVLPALLLYSLERMWLGESFRFDRYVAVGVATVFGFALGLWDRHRTRGCS